MSTTDDVAGLVERLRAHLDAPSRHSISVAFREIREAADALQSAAAEIARLRGALRGALRQEFGWGERALQALAQQGGDDGQ